MKKQNNEESKKKKEREYNPEDYYYYTDDWLPYKTIENGTIITKDNRCIKAIEVLPISFNTKTEKEKNRIVNDFGAFLRVTSTKVHIKTMNFETEADEIETTVTNRLKNETNRGIIECSHDYLLLTRHLAQLKSSSVKYYIFLEHPKKLTQANYEEVMNELTDTRNTAITYLAEAGNACVFKDDVSDSENKFLYELLYKIFNRNAYKTEGLDKRTVRIMSDTAKVNHLRYGIDQLPPIDISSVISPKGISFEALDHTIVNGLYYDFLVIKKKRYPFKVFAGWTAIISKYAKGVDLDIYAERRPHKATLDSVKRQLNWKAQDVGSTSAAKADDVRDEYDNTHFIKERMRAQEDLYDVCMIITISAPSYAELRKMKKDLVYYLKTEDIYTQDCYARQEEVFKSILPGMWVSPAIWRKGRRNFLTSSLSSTYPFTSNQLADKNGVVIATARNGTLCVYNPFDTTNHNNANILITGEAGMGKTYTTQIIARRLRLMGYKMILILPIKAFEYARGCEAVGGSFIEIKPGSTNCLNIFDIKPIDNIDDRYIDGQSYREESLLAQNISRIKTWISLLMQEDKLDIVEKSRIDTTLTTLYSNFGITDDNSSIYDSNGKLKKVPIISDYVKLIDKVPELSRVREALDIFINGLCKNMNGQTNVDDNNDYTVYDVSGCPQELLPAFMYTAISKGYDTLKENRTTQGLIVLDETWLCMRNETAGNQINEMVKVLRGFGGGAVIATQELGDMLNSPGGYGRAVINNTATKIILKPGEQDAEELAKLLRLTETDVAKLTSQKRGQALLIMNKDKIDINVQASYKEDCDFTTDPNRLKQIANERKMMELSKNNL